MPSALRGSSASPAVHGKANEPEHCASDHADGVRVAVFYNKVHAPICDRSSPTLIGHPALELQHALSTIDRVIGDSTADARLVPAA